jgi:hypothetical protein
MTDLQSPASNSQVDAAIKYAESELTAAWQVKASLETRAAALITTNLSAATLYFALQLQFGITPELRGPHTNSFLLTSLISMAFSIGFAVACFIPRRYTGPDDDAFDYILNESTDVSGDVMRGRKLQLARMRQRNRSKARYLLVAIATFGFASVFLIIAIASATLWR